MQNPTDARIEEMQKTTDAIKKRWKVARDLDVDTFIKMMEEEENKSPSPKVALAALHKVRVYLADQGHIDKRLGRDSKRWLRARGLYGSKG